MPAEQGWPEPDSLSEPNLLAAKRNGRLLGMARCADQDQEMGERSYIYVVADNVPSMRAHVKRRKA